MIGCLRALIGRESIPSGRTSCWPKSFDRQRYEPGSKRGLAGIHFDIHFQPCSFHMTDNQDRTLKTSRRVLIYGQCYMSFHDSDVLTR